ncbi:peptidyl-prolyl cis-trans isomerase CYP95 isoform X2 [Diachasma alloeum]|uniref:peptidyl-prolyl cis-trans isomerase CYP95 isoform X2 n=1 Tax=Diachasma alloeum TaxID=454923 RepID=UPI000738132B|nr:peptidyl-prolyl cis-trans isomerase CYP95 isoform X2 [Diachasma alloeum]
MHALHSVGVHHEKSQFFPNIRDCNMDYRQKMIVSTTHKYKNEDDDDEDLEALRLAALKSRRAKPTPSAKAQLPPQHNIHTGRSHFAPYNQRFGRREYYHSNRPPRQNGNVYHPSRVNQNLIEIIPVDESALSATSETKTTPDPLSATDATEPSKFHRYTDDVSGSDDEDLKEAKIPDPKSEDQKPPQDDETGTDKENQSNEGNSPRIEENDPLEDAEEDPEDDQKDPEDDDDILLMADLEEEDSLERLIDEMDREINMEKFPAEKKESSPSKTETRDSKKPRDSSKAKNRSNEKLESLGASKTDRRSVSPYSSSKPMRHRSLSPKQKPRKKSPRRSPPRQIKKSQREPLRLRSPRKSPPRYSPRPRSRSPRMSPRRSPNRSPMRRLSPRGRSPLSRSPRPRRSRSPKILSRPHSPRFINRVRSPLRMSPGRSPLPRSPKQSPHRLSPMRRASPRRSRSRSPRRSPRRSPKLSPRRLSPMRRLSPRLSPRRSPWSSPRNSPRLSPRRRRSPKERKRRSLSPEDPSLHRKENSPLRKNVQNSPEISKKVKPAKETIEVSSDPVLEARRRKFESTRPIDPITANKKIKLSKKEEIKVETAEPQVNSPKRKAREVIEEYEEVPDEELSLHEEYNFDDLEPVLSDESSGPVMCVEVAPVKVEKERVKKKKKKDKEIYQVGKMKDAMLAGRIVKEKKCKKKKELTPEVGEEEGEVVEEAVDEEADLRTELSRRRAERLNRTVPIQSARLLQSAFKGVVNEVAKAKNNAKVIQRHLGKAEEKTSQKEVRRVTVLHRTVPDLSDSEDSKMPVRFRLGTNNSLQETRESKASRKSSKRQGRKVKHKNLSVNDIDRQK